MSALIEIGAVEVATDATMAYEINRPSRSRAAVDARIGPVAAGIIASDPTLIESTRNLVEGAVDDAGLLRQAELGAVRTLAVDDPQYAEVRLSRDFRRTGGTLRTGGVVDGGPGVAASSLTVGAGLVELSRDYRRMQPGADATGMTPADVVIEWLSRLSWLAQWGDSMTTSPTGGGYSQITMTAERLGVTPYDGGRSGHTPTEITFRAGALPVRITVAGGVIPATGTAAATLSHERGWWNWKEIPAYLVTATGQRVRVLLKHTAAAPTEVATWTVEQVGGTGPARILPGTRVAPDTPSAPLSMPAIFWVGRNDPDEGRVLEALDAFLAAHRDPGRRLLVLPIFNRTNSPAGSSTYIRDMAINAALAARAGAAFFDARRVLIDHGLELAGITPTPEDITAIAEDRIPPSLMFDITHLNPAGRLALAIIIVTEILGRNW